MLSPSLLLTLCSFALLFRNTRKPANAKNTKMIKPADPSVIFGDGFGRGGTYGVGANEEYVTVGSGVGAVGSLVDVGSAYVLNEVECV